MSLNIRQLTPTLAAVIGLLVVIAGLLAWQFLRHEVNAYRQDEAREELKGHLQKAREENDKKLRRLEESIRQDEEKEKAKSANSAGKLPVRPGQ